MSSDIQSHIDPIESDPLPVQVSYLTAMTMKLYVQVEFFNTARWMDQSL